MVEGLSEVVTLLFKREDGAEVVDMSGMTARGALLLEGGGESMLEVLGVDGTSGQVVLRFPALPSGRHRYELWLRGESGEEVLLNYGFIGVVPSTGAGERANGLLRVLEVRVPDKAGERVKLLWEGTSIAEKSAEAAIEALTAVRAEKKEVEEKLAEWEGVKEVFVTFPEFVRETISVSSSGTLVLAGWDTGAKIRGEDGAPGRDGVDGEDGHSPYIGENGNWFEWDAEKKSYVDTGLKAAGKDGIDTTGLTPVFVGSREELDSIPEDERAGRLFYVSWSSSGISQTQCWIWGFDANGDGYWRQLQGIFDLATETIPGFVILGAYRSTNAPTKWAPVECTPDSDGRRLCIDVAPHSPTGIGACRIAQTLTDTQEGEGNYTVPRLGAVVEALGEKASSTDLNTHVSRYNNPHRVNYGQAVAYMAPAALLPSSWAGGQLISRVNEGFTESRYPDYYDITHTVGGVNYSVFIGSSNGGQTAAASFYAFSGGKRIGFEVGKELRPTVVGAPLVAPEAQKGDEVPTLAQLDRELEKKADKEGIITRDDVKAMLLELGVVVPTGIICFCLTETVPLGWLICDGRLVSRTEYAALFEAIGTRHNVEGDELYPEMFRLPDARGCVLRGLDSAGGTARGLDEWKDRPVGSYQAAGAPHFQCQFPLAISRDAAKADGVSIPTVNLELYASKKPDGFSPETSSVFIPSYYSGRDYQVLASIKADWMNTTYNVYHDNRMYNISGIPIIKY